MTLTTELTDVLRDGRSRRPHGTPQREQVLSFLSRARTHLLPEEIVRGLRSQKFPLGRATVFRTLKLLERAGVVNRVTGADGLRRVELVRRRAHHDHMVCVKCGGIREFKAPSMEACQARAAQKAGFELMWHHHELYGTCRECGRKR